MEQVASIARRISAALRISGEGSRRLQLVGYEPDGLRPVAVPAHRGSDSVTKSDAQGVR
jgi:hypothetical protein